MQFEITVQSTQEWNNGGNGIITIKNNGDELTNWQFQLTTTNFITGDFWALSKTGTSNNIIIKPAAWKTILAKGETIVSGFSYTFSNTITSLQVSSSTAGVTVVGPTNPTTPTNPTIPTNPTTPSDPSDPGALTSSKKVFGYFTEWSIYDRKFNVNMIKANKLTHILYAFMLPNPNVADYNKIVASYPFPPLPYHPEIAEGTLVYQDEAAAIPNIALLRQLKQQNPNVKILVSIGGWSLSWTFSKVAANSVLRSRFVKSAVAFVISNGFDGVDIDWEYPGKQGIGFNYVDPINDATNLITLFKELRQELNTASPNKHLELTSAVGCDPNVIKRYAGSEPYLDYILLMTYDFAGVWGNGGHHSPLYDNPGKTENSQFNANSAVINTKNIGYSASKICMGFPMYGRGWAKIVPTNPAQPIFGVSSGGAPASYSGAAGEPGLTSWKDLLPIIQGGNGFTRYYDNIAKAAYIHNSATGETWSYDDEESLTAKTQYIVDNNLAGIMFWEQSDDTRNNVRSLLNTVVKNFNTSSPTTPTTPTTPTNNLLITITNNSTTDFILKPNESVNITYP